MKNDSDQKMSRSALTRRMAIKRIAAALSSVAATTALVKTTMEARAASYYSYYTRYISTSYYSHYISYGSYSSRYNSLCTWYRSPRGYYSCR